MPSQVKKISVFKTKMIDLMRERRWDSRLWV